MTELKRVAARWQIVALALNDVIGSGVYLLPASTQFETYGSVTASNRSIQWRDTVVDPLFESLPEDFTCPDCGVRYKEDFEPADED